MRFPPGTNLRRKKPGTLRRRGKEAAKSMPQNLEHPRPRLELVATPAAGAPGWGLTQKRTIAANLDGGKAALVALHAINMDRLSVVTGGDTTVKARDTAALQAVGTSIATSVGVAGRVETKTKVRSIAALAADTSVAAKAG